MLTSPQSTHDVNLVTGNISLPITLVNAPGQNGLDIEVSITYSSNIRKQVETWNPDAPTGILGLGWSLARTAIIRDTKGTGTSLDDTFYLMTDGASKLIQAGQEGDNLIYETENYQLWKIIYNSTLEEWKIIQEDGTTFILGGGVNTDPSGNKQSQGNSVEWGVKWGNWIGSSRVTEGQSQFAVAWNLATVESPYGQRLNFTYDQVQKLVGGTSGKFYTQASYLTQISAEPGYSVKFIYSEKDSDEYEFPLSSGKEPTVYQERFQTKFLDELEVHNESNTKLYSVKLVYNHGKGEFLSNEQAGEKMKKRVLTSIQKVNPDGKSYEPPHTFTYYGQDGNEKVSVSRSDNSHIFNSETQALYGALKSITTPTVLVLKPMALLDWL